MKTKAMANKPRKKPPEPIAWFTIAPVQKVKLTLIIYNGYTHKQAFVYRGNGPRINSKKISFDRHRFECLETEIEQEIAVVEELLKQKNWQSKVQRIRKAENTD